MELHGDDGEMEGNSIQIDESKWSGYIEKSKEDSLALIKQVFFNDVILHRLFCCMDLSLLKTCRLVCKKWKYICDPLFKKNCEVPFDFRDEETVSSNSFRFGLRNSRRKSPSASTVTKLIDVFGGNSLEIPFTSFRLKGNVPLTIPVLCTIFNIGQFMKELTLDNIIIPNNLKNDISELLPASLTKLTVICSTTANLRISNDRLRFLSSISLIGCIIHLTNETKMKPMEIELRNVIFTLENEEVDLDPVFLNDLIDLRQTTKLVLAGNYYILDLSHLKTIDYVGLSDIDIKLLNWKNCRFSVRKLVLFGVPFLTQNQMQIKELIFGASSVDLAVLPKNLQRLSLKFADIKCSDEILCLPNLKYLHLEDTHNESSCLSSFVTSSLLVDLKLESTYGRIGLNFNNIPRNLHRMHLTQVNITGNGSYKLNTLVLQNYDYQIMSNILDKLHPEHLVISINDVHLNYNKILKLLIQKSIKTIAVGKFQWEDIQEQGITYPNYVKMKTEYYSFQNGKEEALDEEKFAHLLSQVQ